MKKFKICKKCFANTPGTFIGSTEAGGVVNFNGQDYVSTHTRPSKKPKCGKCGEKVREFWLSL